MSLVWADLPMWVAIATLAAQSRRSPGPRQRPHARELRSPLLVRIARRLSRLGLRCCGDAVITQHFLIADSHPPTTHPPCLSFFRVGVSSRGRSPPHTPGRRLRAAAATRAPAAPRARGAVDRGRADGVLPAPSTTSLCSRPRSVEPRIAARTAPSTDLPPSRRICGARPEPGEAREQRHVGGAVGPPRHRERARPPPRSLASSTRLARAVATRPAPRRRRRAGGSPPPVAGSPGWAGVRAPPIRSRRRPR